MPKNTPSYSGVDANTYFPKFPSYSGMDAHTFPNFHPTRVWMPILSRISILLGCGCPYFPEFPSYWGVDANTYFPEFPSYSGVDAHTFPNFHPTRVWMPIQNFPNFHSTRVWMPIISRISILLGCGCPYFPEFPSYSGVDAHTFPNFHPTRVWMPILSRISILLGCGCQYILSHFYIIPSPTVASLLPAHYFTRRRRYQKKQENADTAPVTHSFRFVGIATIRDGGDVWRGMEQNNDLFALPPRRYCCP
ncbi:hypothetical protein JTE90_007646 [Oedothorax gibbosus]|uniref:Uncharacterized protein n=1 Tax=Oedothorax gibbosus TaxID=931172 RepID=A0AAV6UIV8_9ARAC|nr:hypothetical protein JTE90_007646 [Oedothorax gibbosus]